MKKRGFIFFLCILMITVTACGTSPKKELNQAIERIKKVDNYKEKITLDETVTVLSNKKKRKVILDKEIDNEHQVEKRKTKTTKEKDTYQEERYFDRNQKVVYSKDPLTNAWKKEKIKIQEFLDFSIITNDDVKVEAVKSDKRLHKKYQVELSKEDMKRLFYRQLNEEYISMRIHEKGTIYFYINSSDYLTQIDINLTPLIDMRDPDTTCNNMKLKIQFSDYNNLEEVKIPLYVTASAVDEK
ncbi:MAG: hypothetical protein KH135_07105 [Firmicutes bacterium]|nr:hypothetical protein [Bacillota bacterium]